MNRAKLKNIINCRGSLVSYLMNNGILKEKRVCRGCRNPMKLVEGGGLDGFRWKCFSKKCGRRVESIRKGSKFEKIRAPLKTIMSVIYEWCVNTPIKNIKREEGVNSKLVNSVFLIIRESIKKKNKEKLGGVGCVIEVDETAISKRKYGKGRIGKQFWCVGGICRTTKQVFFEVSQKRNKATLNKIVQENVLRGSSVYTDEWAGYNDLNSLGYIHKTVCHKTHFLNPQDATINTQMIESTWRWMKVYRKLYGSNFKKNFEDYIIDFQFKRNEPNVYKKILPRLKTLFLFK